MARWQDPYLPIITSCWRCLPGLLPPPPPSQLRVDPLRAVLGKSLSAAGEECGGRAARAVLGEEGECQAFTFLLL